MKTPQKCPFSVVANSAIIKKIASLIDTVRNQVNKLTENDPFTHKFGREYLGIKNTKREFDNKFKNMSIFDMKKFATSDNNPELHLLVRYINHQLAVYIFQKMMPEIHKIDFHTEGYENYKNFDQYVKQRLIQRLIDELTTIAQDVLDDFYGEVELGQDDDIHSMFRIQSSLLERNTIPESLSETLFRDGIRGAVYTIQHELDILLSNKLPKDVNIFTTLQSLESTWKDFALSNLPLLYIGTYEGNTMNGSKNQITGEKKHDSDKEFSKYVLRKSQNTILPNITKREFKKAVKVVLKKSGKIDTNNLGLGCPLLFTKANDYKGDKVNGITAYQRALYKIIFGGILGYLEYEKNNI